MTAPKIPDPAEVPVIATDEPTQRRCRSRVDVGSLTFWCERTTSHTGLHYVTQLTPATAMMWIDDPAGPIEYLLQRFECMEAFVGDVCSAFPVISRFATFKKLSDLTRQAFLPLDRRRRSSREE